jgi:hypothetical protein
VTVRLVSRAADEGGFHLHLQAKFFVNDFQNFDRFSDDFCTNAVTGEDCDFHS